MRVEKSKVNANVFFLKNGGKILATKNLVKGFRFSDERLFTIGDVEYREWIPNRSKIAAAILNGLKVLPIEKGSRVLYLGAAAGQTASYCSDIVGKDGVVYCVEISDRVLRELILRCAPRENMLPILADASKIEEYGDLIKEADFVFQDIAQRNQVEILIRNCEYFLRQNSFGMLAVKARSIDVVEQPSKIFKKVEEELRRQNFEIVDYKRLEPFERDHCVFLVKKQKA